MRKKVLIGVILSLLLLSGCNDRQESPAPGCGGGGLVPTGCLGKSYIRDMTVEPATACLTLDANNCNGGILTIDNTCEEDLVLAGKRVYAGSSGTVEFVRNADGEIVVIEPSGNFGQYVPEDEDLLSVTGRLGEQEITISYVKENVCGEAKIPRIGTVSLMMDKTEYGAGEEIAAHVDYERMLFTGFPAFEVYRQTGSGWELVDVHDLFCAMPCSADESELCAGPIACAPLPEHCTEFDPLFEELVWDQTITKTREVTCQDSETARCSFTEQAGPGTYKIVFSYTSECVNEDYFEDEANTIQTTERVFQIQY